jgi:hypothetical protein
MLRGRDPGDEAMEFIRRPFMVTSSLSRWPWPGLKGEPPGSFVFFQGTGGGT